MKAKKLLALAGVSVAGAFLLAACGGGSSNQATYSFVYSADPNTLDYIAATRTTTSDVTSNLVDGLLENDRYGNFVPSLAEDWTVSEDGLTYTYKLRKDAKWYTSEGEEYGAVTAQDFVTGIKHAVESKSEGLFLIQNSIAILLGQFRMFSQVKIFSEEGQSESQIVASLSELSGRKVNPYQVKFALRDSRKLSLSFLKQAMMTFIETDYAIKSGTYDKDYLFDLALLKVANSV